MSEVKKPTIQIKTSSPACSEIVVNWALAQKNVNKSVTQLIELICTYTGNVEFQDINLIKHLNSLLYSGGVMPTQVTENQTIVNKSSHISKVENEEKSSENAENIEETTNELDNHLSTKKKVPERPNAKGIVK